MPRGVADAERRGGRAPRARPRSARRPYARSHLPGRSRRARAPEGWARSTHGTRAVTRVDQGILSEQPRDQAVCAAGRHRVAQHESVASAHPQRRRNRRVRSRVRSSPRCSRAGRPREARAPSRPAPRSPGRRRPRGGSGPHPRRRRWRPPPPSVARGERRTKSTSRSDRQAEPERREIEPAPPQSGMRVGHDRCQGQPGGKPHRHLHPPSPSVVEGTDMSVPSPKNRETTEQRPHV